MNCDDCRQRLQARLDGETVGGDDLDGHLRHCPECRALHAAAGRLHVGLLSAAASVPPAGLADRIVAGVLADRRSRQRSRRVLVFALAGLAAAAALALAVMLPKSGPQSVMVQAPPDPAPEPPPSLTENVEKATSAVASLARRTADQTVSDGQLLVPAVSLPMPPEEVLAPPLDPPAESLLEAGHGVANGLEPVANHARRAFNLFLRDMPPMTPENKSGL
jgi:anti-sigma factor RsiW